MMRKILLIVILVLFPFVVNADEDKLTNAHIYGIEKFEISGNRIFISGYSFVSHMDNWGGKNLKTYIVAYTGNWKAEYEKCSDNNPNCYMIKTSEYPKPPEQPRDFWGARCTDNACKYEEAVKAEVLAGNWINDTSCTISGTRSSVPESGSHCLYYNVGFSTNIDLDNLFLHFSGGTATEVNDVKFKIISTIDSVEKPCGGNSCVSDMGIYNQVCRKNGSFCSNNGDEISSGDYKFTIGDMSNTAYFAAKRVGVKDSAGNNVIYDGWRRYVFAGETQCNGACNYEILEISDDLESLIYIKGEEKFSVPGLFFKLRAKWNGKSYISGDDKNPNNPLIGVGNVFPSTSGDEGYWVGGDRLQIIGNFKISNLKRDIVKKTCNDIFGTNSSNSKTTQTVNCGKSGSYRSCNSQPITGYLYYPTTSDCTYYGKTLINGSYYIRVSVSTDVLFNQTATFSFGSVSPTVVYAGKGFGLGSTTYENSITWANANQTYNGIPHYTYGSNWKKIGGSCTAESISLSDSSNLDVYYEDIDGNMKNAKLSEASVEAINVEILKKKIKSSNVNNIGFQSCDSNDSTGCVINNPNYSVKGKWNEFSTTAISDYKIAGNNWLFGKKITNKFSYQLADSCVIVKGTNVSDVVYGNDITAVTGSCISTGQKYYVDFKWPYSSKNYFPFNLKKSINPSFLESMKWTLNGSCKLNIKEGYYNDPGSPGDDSNPVNHDNLILNIKYRSIDVSNPFPKNVIARNWQEWYKLSSNKVRLAESYKGDSLYEITLSKLGGTGMIKISDINSINRHYLDTSNFELNGSSDFVDKYFSKKVSIADKSYCPLGTFSNSCDS